MPEIEDFLQPLEEGVWEVSVPLNLVTDPLGNDWIKSQINVPTPGTIASYRKGQFHLHETQSEYKVHLDRYDPANHPVLHLIADAPLLLMISETFITLISLTRRSSLPGVAERLERQNRILRHHLILGTMILILGLGILFAPDLTFKGITRLIIPVAVFLSGVYTLWGGITFSPFTVTDRNNLINGIWIIAISLILAEIPPLLWSAAILVLLAVWMFASAGMLLGRVLQGRQAVPEGFFSRLLIGIISLILGVFCLIAPGSVIYFLLWILGILTITLGGAIILIGIGLREMMKRPMRSRRGDDSQKST